MRVVLVKRPSATALVRPDRDTADEYVGSCGSRTGLDFERRSRYVARNKWQRYYIKTKNSCKKHALTQSAAALVTFYGEVSPKIFVAIEFLPRVSHDRGVSCRPQ